MWLVTTASGAGRAIKLEDLASTPVAASSSTLIPASRADEIVGQIARVELTKGEFVQTTQITDSSPTADGHTIVGLSLEAGRFPAGGLSPGDVVDIVSVVNGSGSSGTSAANPGPGSGGGSGSSSGSGTAPLERSDSGSGADSGTASGSVTNAQVLDAVPSSGKDGDWTSGATVSGIGGLINEMLDQPIAYLPLRLVLLVHSIVLLWLLTSALTVAISLGFARLYRRLFAREAGQLTLYLATILGLLLTGLLIGQCPPLVRLFNLVLIF